MNNNKSPETRELISGGNKYQHYDEIDLGDADCISPDDVSQNLWIICNLKLDNLIITGINFIADRIKSRFLGHAAYCGFRGKGLCGIFRIIQFYW